MKILLVVITWGGFGAEKRPSGTVWAGGLGPPPSNESHLRHSGELAGREGSAHRPVFT